MSDQTQRPKSLLHFLVMLVKSFIKGLPKLIVRNIVIIIVISAAILVIHTYLLVDVNEGFWYSPLNNFSGMINVRNEDTGAVTFWAVAVFFLAQLWRRSRTKGLKKTIGEIVSLPIWLISCIKDSGKVRFIALSIGIALSILISIFVTNNWTILIFTLMATFSFSSRAQSLLLLAVTLVISDFNKIFRKKAKQQSPSVAASALVVAGLAIGFGVSLFIPDIIWLQTSIILLLLVLSILQVRGLISSKAAAGFLIFGGIQLILLRFNVSFADDGGLSEAGGTWKSWVGSPGAGTAVKMGLTPAAAGAGGAVSGIFAGDLINELDFEVGEDGIDVEVEEVTELVLPNGNRQLKFPDGSIKEIWPDGTVTGTTSDGTTFIQKTNGELEIKDPNGEVITEYPDGRIVTEKNNGLVITDNPDGSQIIYDHEFNETIIHNTDGTRTIIDEYGKSTIVDSNDNILEITTKDGYRGVRKDDGTVEITNPSHEGKIIIDQDQNIKGTIIEKDGTKFDFSGDDSSINITTSEGLELNVDEDNVMTGDLGNGNKLIREVGSGKTKIEMENGSSVIFHDDGQITGKDTETGYDFEIINEDSIEMKDGNGNYTKVNSDGSFEIKTEDGWSGHGNSNGERHLEAPNGNNMTIKDDGSVIVEYNDGSVGKINTDKSVELKRPDGTIERSIDNQVTVEKPDGTIEKLSMEEYTQKYQ